jgi:hypothetical protein
VRHPIQLARFFRPIFDRDFTPRHGEHHAALSLKLRGDVLNGAMIAQSLPSSRVGLALTHWVELRKE